MILHVRHHTSGFRPDLRIWTDEMQQYGQFNIASYDNVTSFIKIGQKLGIIDVKFHDCDIDCTENTCGPLSYGETIPEVG